MEKKKADADREARVLELKRLVANDEYKVDSERVAVAIVRKSQRSKRRSKAQAAQKSS